MAINLLNDVKGIVEKEKLGVNKTYFESYKTGLDVLDYRNGRIEGNDVKLGINSGNILTVIGKSGTGKSTLAIQIATSIAQEYENSQIIHFDFEHATNLARIQAVSGWSEDMLRDKYLLLNSSIYSESVYKLIKSISTLKQSKREELEIDLNKKDIYGNPIKVLPPTLVLIDSWATMIPKNISEEEELSGSMSASAIAKTNNAIVKRVGGALEESNITLIIVNHITQKIDIGLVKTQAQINYLKQDESVPGRSTASHSSDIMA